MSYMSCQSFFFFILLLIPPCFPFDLVADSYGALQNILQLPLIIGTRFAFSSHLLSSQ